MIATSVSSARRATVRGGTIGLALRGAAGRPAVRRDLADERRRRDLGGGGSAAGGACARARAERAGAAAGRED